MSEPSPDGTSVVPGQPSGDYPVAVCPGKLDLGGTLVDCYVLDTGARVISLRSAVLSLTGMEHGNLGEIIGVAGLKPFLDSGLVLGESLTFGIPRSPLLGRGLTADSYLHICKAYVAALQAGALRTTRQQAIAAQCAIIATACAHVGLVALIDEATGYQSLRAETELQTKLRLYIAAELREWEKTFPDELWWQFKRLTGSPLPIHSRPKWWGKLVTELIYEALDPDLARHLRENHPDPRYKQNWHQWLTEEVGLPALQAHIREIIGISRTCRDMDHLREVVALAFKTRDAQLPLLLRDAA